MACSDCLGGLKVLIYGHKMRPDFSPRPTHLAKHMKVTEHRDCSPYYHSIQIKARKEKTQWIRSQINADYFTPAVGRGDSPKN